MSSKITMYLHYICLILGLSLQDVESIISIVAFVISIVAAICTIVIKIKLYKSNDGKIDNEELQDILEEIEKLKGGKDE